MSHRDRWYDIANAIICTLKTRYYEANTDTTKKCFKFLKR